MQLLSEAKTLSIVLRVYTHAFKFCRQAISFVSKITKIVIIESKWSVKQSKESQCKTDKYITSNTSMSSFLAVHRSSGSFLSILSFKKEQIIHLNFKSRKVHLETVWNCIRACPHFLCLQSLTAKPHVVYPYDVIEDGAEKVEEWWKTKNLLKVTA